MTIHSSILAWKIPMDRGACDRVANSCTITEWLRTHTHTHLGYLESCVASIKDWWYFLFIWITLFRTEIKSTFPPKLHLHVCFLLFVLICSSRLHFSFFFFISESPFPQKVNFIYIIKILIPISIFFPAWFSKTWWNSVNILPMNSEILHFSSELCDETN